MKNSEDSFFRILLLRMHCFIKRHEIIRAGYGFSPTYYCNECVNRDESKNA